MAARSPVSSAAVSFPARSLIAAVGVLVFLGLGACGEADQSNSRLSPEYELVPRTPEAVGTNAPGSVEATVAPRVGEQSGGGAGIGPGAGSDRGPDENPPPGSPSPGAPGSGTGGGSSASPPGPSATPTPSSTR